VTDLAEAHALALRHLLSGGSSHSLNLGNGQGYSVFEILQAIEAVTGRRVPHQIGARRPGDPARLVADASLAEKILGWSPERSDLQTLLADAWRWENRIDGDAARNPV
jgi:UDP-glucose 4-epimerase